MVERRRRAHSAGGHYFPAEAGGAQFIPSGCTVLDCVLGGGWPLGRVANIVGDKAVGKTLLAIEACANFRQRYPGGHIWYREAEAAFDEHYARDLGLPVGSVDFGPEGAASTWDTVEDIFEDLDARLADAEKSGQPGLYIVDSLDALSSRAEMKRRPEEGTFGLEKQKQLGQMLRRLTRRLRAARVALLVISQIRDKIGVMFGDRHSRTGGKALDFYASQILWLHHIKTESRTINKVKRPTAVWIRAKCKKNKVAPSFRECEFMLQFGYGVDDIEASVGWLEEVGMLDRAGIKKSEVSRYLRESAGLSSEDARARRAQLAGVVVRAWREIEAGFAPRQSKYGCTP